MGGSVCEKHINYKGRQALFRIFDLFSDICSELTWIRLKWYLKRPESHCNTRIVFVIISHIGR